MSTVKEILYKDGDKYNGEVNSDGKLEGRGLYEFKNGSYYKGEFRNGVFQGEGQLFDKTNNLTIEGQFVDGKASCQEGKVRYSDESMYTGGIKENMREGQGTYIFPKESEFKSYEGSFKKDKFQGIGTLIFKNGNQYRGYFTNGVYNGRGEIKTPAFAYKGDFRNGWIEGDGYIVYAGGQTYKGAFKFNRKHGQGKYTYKDGSIYEGQWKEDKREGKGKLSFPNNQCYEGDFQQDQMCGVGKYQTPDYSIEGEFQKSKLNGQGVTIFPQTNTTMKGIYKNGLKNGFFQVTRQIKDQTIWYRGQFINDKQHKFNKTTSSRI